MRSKALLGGVIMIVVCGLLAFNVSCGKKVLKPNLTAEERFEAAKKLFDRKHYLEAKTQFQIVILNNPGSSVADKAQFYLAECHFKLKEYILAASEYERLVRSYPNSPLVDDAQYKIGMCYYKLSPKYSLDQKYTHKAIDEFQRFLEDFPQSDLVGEVEKRVFELRTKLAKKEFKAGEQYRKMGYYVAAIIYFNSVLEDYYDTKYSEKAQYWKAECLRRLQKFAEAKTEFENFIQRYPSSRLIRSVKDKIEEINNHLSSSNSQDSEN